MNIRQMEVFWAIMRTGTVTGAAKFLGLSQPAASKILQHAEDLIGMPLFTRRGGKLHPTREAEDLFALSESIFDTVEQMQRAVQDLQRGHTGRLQVAATPGITTTLLLAPIARFLVERPQVNFSMRILSSHEIVTRIARNQVDLGVLYGPIPDASLQAIDLTGLDVICAVPVNSPLARRDEITPRDIAGERLISFNFNLPWAVGVAAAFEEAGVPFHVGVEANHPTVAMSLVQAGVGVALLPSDMLNWREYPQVKRLRFAPRMTIRLYAVCRPERLSRLATFFIENLRTCFAESPPERLAGRTG
ncbi:LysR family transcriptional regulator [Ancylobacter mangrovi]|uniref:LysR family transcriptional regulator n=1 Tax=Ancylobacter mangrovi TaxID=2972472 RepID=UPI002162C396|nr:LysR family transcriptional regulator [Ancylobacter mangrovi]MCS0502310.1 LysR family transcriptional regulator [Ancylobacter mangrovi]